MERVRQEPGLRSREWAEAEVERVLAELREGLERLRGLGEMLSVCGSCKSIRDGSGEWRRMEDFFGQQLRLRFSHGLCPCCSGRLLADIEGEAAGQIEAPTASW